MQKFIIDSDWGSDVMQLTSVLAADSEAYKVLGATVTFGNATHAKNLINAGAMLRLLNLDSTVPYFPGSLAPLGEAAAPEGDCAHGSNGLGNVEVPASTYPAQEQDAADFILETLAKETSGSVTLIATGPQSNIARAILKDPKTMQRLKEIRIMAGCTSPLPGYWVDHHTLERLDEKAVPRFGNITEWAEFNFQQAPKDAAVVLESGIPVRLFPMNCTHQMCFTAEREAKLRAAFADDLETADLLASLLSIPRTIDKQKFDIDPTLHDVHTTLELVAPELYAGRQGKVSIVSEDAEAHDYGHTIFIPDPAGPHWVGEHILDPDAAFERLLDSLLKTVGRPSAVS